MNKLSLVIFGLLLGFWYSDAGAQFALSGKEVHTVSGAVIADGVVLVKDGKIQKVGKADKIKVPNGYTEIRGEVITPGFVDAHATVGLSGIYNRPGDMDQLEKSSPLQPDLRTIDAYNPREELVAYLNRMGITTVHTGHAPAALVSGQSAVFKTQGNSVEDALLKEAPMLTMCLDPVVSQVFASPGTRAKGVAMIREALNEARNYAPKEGEAPDLKKQALKALLDGKMKALITVHKAHDILTALRIAKEYSLKLVLDGVAEAYLVLDEIKASGAEVILHPSMARKHGSLENASFETAKILHEAGIAFALQSGYEPYVPKTRVVRYEAAIAARYGLPFDAALRSVTLNAARIAGVADRVGSLEPGKDADIVVFDGDPFEYLTKVKAVLTNGELTWSAED